MNRPISFRAKDFEGIWRYGSLRHYLGEWFIYENSKHQVDGDTIGQITGFLDKNGKEIYDGDILRFTFPKPKGNKKQIIHFHKVLWNEKYGAWWMQKLPNGENKMIKSNAGTHEVVGNIFDNPELK